MPFAAVLPLIIIGVVITILRKSAEQNKRQQAQKRAAEEQAKEAASEGQAQYRTVRPSVQVPPVRKATPAPWTEGTAPKGPVMHTDHDRCALKKEDPKAKNKHPEHDLCALDSNAINDPHAAAAQTNAQQTNGAMLQLTPDRILNGVILSEILGKPKALR